MKHLLIGLAAALFAGCTTAPPIHRLDSDITSEVEARLKGKQPASDSKLEKVEPIVNQREWTGHTDAGNDNLMHPVGTGKLVLEYKNITVTVHCFNGQMYVGIEAKGPGKFLWQDRPELVCPINHQED
jgi:outer membrane biogenesis lipoprotein LolB